MAEHRDNTRLARVAIVGATVCFLVFIGCVFVLGMLATGVLP